MLIAVRSVAVPDPGPLLDLTDPADPLALVRAGDGIVGTGRALRLAFRGPGRIREAADAWRDLCESAHISDEVAVPGSGLVAFGSFAFAAGSALDSVLIVPSVVYGRRGGVCWRTTIQIDGGDPPADPPRPGEITAFPPVRFGAGRFGPDEYQRAVDAAVTRIQAGLLSKAVLARDLTGRVGGAEAELDLRGPLHRLAAAYPSAVTFAVDRLVGASPETLVRVEDGEVTARVLAGTGAPGPEGGARLLGSHKDLDEHGLARASVVTALARHTTGLDGGEPFALELPNLWHIASDLHGRLGDRSSALDLVAELHPTAAVGGTPTDAALDLIAELEPLDRGRYAGPVGWIDAAGSGEWAVALRAAQVGDGTVTAYAGAGVVADSVPELELAETELKFRPVLEAFG